MSRLDLIATEEPPEGAPEAEHFRTHAEAIEGAISDLRRDGGGSMWIHREDCPASETGDECPCGPVEVYVEAGH